MQPMQPMQRPRRYWVCENSIYATIYATLNLYLCNPKNTMTKTRQICDDCGVKFEVLETKKYKTLCKSCFIEFKKVELDYLKNRVKQLENENKLLKSTSGIDADLLKRLKHLCHPDKHNGSVGVPLLMGRKYTLRNFSPNLNLQNHLLNRFIDDIVY